MIRPFLLGAAPLLLIPVACAPTVPSQSVAAPVLAPMTLNAWQTVATEPYKGKRDSISMVDESTGWYGTGAGDLFRTTDGGATWSKIASRPGTFVRAVAFLDRNTGFIGNIGTDYYPGVSDTVPLYRTDDGGKTWTAVDTGPATIKGVCAIDIVRQRRVFQGSLRESAIVHAAGRVGGPAGLLRSTDGGRTWAVIDMSTHIGMITDVRFRDGQVGFVFGASDPDIAKAEGQVLMTRDGGRSWREVYRSGRAGEIIWKADLPSARVGYGTVMSYDTDRTQQVVIKSTDGGESWQEVPLVADSGARQFGVGFIDERTGFVGTAKGGFATDDGGLSWQPVPIAPAANKLVVVRGEGRGRVWAIGTQVQVFDFDLSRR